MNKDLPINIVNTVACQQRRGIIYFKGKRGKESCCVCPCTGYRNVILSLSNKNLISDLNFCFIRSDNLQGREGRKIVSAVKLRMNVELSCEQKKCCTTFRVFFTWISSSTKRIALESLRITKIYSCFLKATRFSLMSIGIWEVKEKGWIPFGHLA